MTQKQLQNLIKESAFISSEKKKILLSQLSQYSDVQLELLEQIMAFEQNQTKLINKNYQKEMTAITKNFKNLEQNFEKHEMPTIIRKNASNQSQNDQLEAEKILKQNNLL